jgi:hypothetical protein
MISEIALGDLPVREARSDCDNPNASIVSRRVSPGGTGSTGENTADLAMVVLNRQDADIADLSKIDPPVRKSRDWIGIAFENEAEWLRKVDRELALPVAIQLVKPSPG